jgi:hypothetical protein
MNNVYLTKYTKIGIVFLLAALLLIGGRVLAQSFIAATESGGETEEMAPSYVSGDPAYENITPPDENLTTGITTPAANFSYVQVTGATLRGRSSTAEYAYDANGCSHTIAGEDKGRILNTELHLPDNAIIKYLRVYYNDKNPNTGVDGFITMYEPGVVFTDVVNTGSPQGFAGGYGFAVSKEITETVDNAIFAYTLIGWPGENNVNNQICGLRVAYYAPFHGTIFMPVIHR